MNEATPPRRAPHYFDNEQYGWTLDQCARGLLSSLWGFVYRPIDFRGDANGHAWLAHSDANTAWIAFSSDKGNGNVQLTVHESHWVKVELYVSGALIFRAWAEEAYEEKELWPDAADGVTPPDGDAPGRISKRGHWLQLRCEDFPDMPKTESGYWAIELPDTVIHV